MKAFAFVIVFFIGTAFAEDDLKSEAEHYLLVHSSAVEGMRWMKWWRDTADQMQKDNPAISGEDVAADTYLFTYLADRRKKLQKDQPVTLTDAEKVELCRFYLLYQLRNWPLPERIRPLATAKNYKYILDGNDLRELDKK